MFKNAKGPKEIILVLQYLDENTTSTLRFQSLINEFSNRVDCYVKVLIIQYPILNTTPLGLELSQKDDFEIDNFRVIKYSPKFNKIQKLGFFFLNKNNKLFWKCFQFIRIISLGRDIFYFNNIDDLLEIKDYAIENGYVIALGGPFSLFSIAKDLAYKFNYKLILDYRDPWTFGYIPLGGIKFFHQVKNNIERKHELALLKRASLITTVSSSLMGFFPTEFQHKVKVIPNGSNYKEEEIEKVTSNKTFNIVYAGTIYNEQLIDLTFFESFKIFLKDKDPKNISLQFIGSFNNPLLKQILNKFGILHVCIVSKRVLRNDLLKILNDSSVFLHLKYGDKKDIISSKQANYLAFRRPILLPKDDNGDLSKSIIENKAGFVCNSVDDNVKILNSLYLKFLNKENLFVNQPNDFLNSISRTTIAKKFVDSVLEK